MLKQNFMTSTTTRVVIPAVTNAVRSRVPTTAPATVKQNQSISFELGTDLFKVSAIAMATQLNVVLQADPAFLRVKG